MRDSKLDQAPGLSRHVIWLHEAPAERSLVGGKGASLSDLAALGAPVPPAFALTTRTYNEFAKSLALPQRASDVCDDDLPGIRASIELASIPDHISDAIESSFLRLKSQADGSIGFAVRSSATAEDSAEFSFAGLHDTVLDVRDLPELKRAIKQCWASLWSERAVTYRRAGGFSPDDAAMAVVVQQLVRSDVSFVVFTADPVSGHDQHLVIAATWGLGEAVVAGLVVPDHIVIGPGGEVIEYVVGDKELMVIPAATTSQGSREVPVPKAMRRMPVMTEAQASEIGRLARGLSSKLGFQADIEGGFYNGTMYLFQARPITTPGALNGHLRSARSEHFVDQTTVRSFPAIGIRAMRRRSW